MTSVRITSRELVGQGKEADWFPCRVHCRLHRVGVPNGHLSRLVFAVLWLARGDQSPIADECEVVPNDQQPPQQSRGILQAPDNGLQPFSVDPRNGTMPLGEPHDRCRADPCGSHAGE